MFHLFPINNNNNNINNNNNMVWGLFEINSRLIQEIQNIIIWKLFKGTIKPQNH